MLRPDIDRSSRWYKNVDVTFELPRSVAKQLRDLAVAGDTRLKEIGILKVHIRELSDARFREKEADPFHFKEADLHKHRQNVLAKQNELAQIINPYASCPADQWHQGKYLSSPPQVVVYNALNPAHQQGLDSKHGSLPNYERGGFRTKIIGISRGVLTDESIPIDSRALEEVPAWLVESSLCISFRRHGRCEVACQTGSERASYQPRPSGTRHEPMNRQLIARSELIWDSNGRYKVYGNKEPSRRHSIPNAGLSPNDTGNTQCSSESILILESLANSLVTADEKVERGASGDYPSGTCPSRDHSQSKNTTKGNMKETDILGKCSLYTTTDTAQHVSQVKDGSENDRESDKGSLQLTHKIVGTVCKSVSSGYKDTIDLVAKPFDYVTYGDRANKAIDGQERIGDTATERKQSDERMTLKSAATQGDFKAAFSGVQTNEIKFADGNRTEARLEFLEMDVTDAAEKEVSGTLDSDGKKRIGDDTKALRDEPSEETTNLPELRQNSESITKEEIPGKHSVGKSRPSNNIGFKGSLPISVNLDSDYLKGITARGNESKEKWTVKKDETKPELLDYNLSKELEHKSPLDAVKFMLKRKRGRPPKSGANFVQVPILEQAKKKRGRPPKQRNPVPKVLTTTLIEKESSEADWDLSSSSIQLEENSFVGTNLASPSYGVNEKIRGFAHSEEMKAEEKADEMGTTSSFQGVVNCYDTKDIPSMKGREPNSKFESTIEMVESTSNDSCMLEKEIGNVSSNVAKAKVASSFNRGQSHTGQYVSMGSEALAETCPHLDKSGGKRTSSAVHGDVMDGNLQPRKRTQAPYSNHPGSPIDRSGLGEMEMKVRSRSHRWYQKDSIDRDIEEQYVRLYTSVACETDQLIPEDVYYGENYPIIFADDDQVGMKFVDMSTAFKLAMRENLTKKSVEPMATIKEEGRSLDYSKAFAKETKQKLETEESAKETSMFDKMQSRRAIMVAKTMKNPTTKRKGTETSADIEFTMEKPLRKSGTEEDKPSHGMNLRPRRAVTLGEDYLSSDSYDDFDDTEPDNGSMYDSDESSDSEPLINKIRKAAKTTEHGANNVFETLNQSSEMALSRNVGKEMAMQTSLASNKGAETQAILEDINSKHVDTVAVTTTAALKERPIPAERSTKYESDAPQQERLAVTSSASRLGQNTDKAWHVSPKKPSTSENAAKADTPVTSEKPLASQKLVESQHFNTPYGRITPQISSNEQPVKSHGQLTVASNVSKGIKNSRPKDADLKSDSFGISLTSKTPYHVIPSNQGSDINDSKHFSTTYVVKEEMKPEHITDTLDVNEDVTVQSHENCVKEKCAVKEAEASSAKAIETSQLDNSMKGKDVVAGDNLSGASLILEKMQIGDGERAKYHVENVLASEVSEDKHDVQMREELDEAVPVHVCQGTEEKSSHVSDEVLPVVDTEREFDPREHDTADRSIFVKGRTAGNEAQDKGMTEENYGNVEAGAGAINEEPEKRYRETNFSKAEEVCKEKNVEEINQPIPLSCKKLEVTEERPGNGALNEAAAKRELDKGSRITRLIKRSIKLISNTLGKVNEKKREDGTRIEEVTGSQAGKDAAKTDILGPHGAECMVPCKELPLKALTSVPKEVKMESSQEARKESQEESVITPLNMDEDATKEAKSKSTLKEDTTNVSITAGDSEKPNNSNIKTTVHCEERQGISSTASRTKNHETMNINVQTVKGSGRNYASILKSSATPLKSQPLADDAPKFNARPCDIESSSKLMPGTTENAFKGASSEESEGNIALALKNVAGEGCVLIENKAYVSGDSADGDVSMKNRKENTLKNQGQVERYLCKGTELETDSSVTSNVTKYSKDIALETDVEIPNSKSKLLLVESKESDKSSALALSPTEVFATPADDKVSPQSTTKRHIEEINAAQCLLGLFDQSQPAAKRVDGTFDTIENPSKDKIGNSLIPGTVETIEEQVAEQKDLHSRQIDSKEDASGSSGTVLIGSRSLVLQDKPNSTGATSTVAGEPGANHESTTVKELILKGPGQNVTVAKKQECFINSLTDEGETDRKSPLPMLVNDSVARKEDQEHSIMAVFDEPNSDIVIGNIFDSLSRERQSKLSEEPSPLRNDKGTTSNNDDFEGNAEESTISIKDDISYTQAGNVFDNIAITQSVKKDLADIVVSEVVGTKSKDVEKGNEVKIVSSNVTTVELENGEERKVEKVVEERVKPSHRSRELNQENIAEQDSLVLKEVKELKEESKSKRKFCEHEVCQVIKEVLIQKEDREEDGKKGFKKELTGNEDFSEHKGDMKQQADAEEDGEKALKHELTSKEDVTQSKEDLIQMEVEEKDSEKRLKKEWTSKEDVAEHEKDLKQRSGEEKDIEKALKKELTSKEDVNEHKGDLIQRNREAKDSEKALKNKLTSKADVTEHKEDLIQRNREAKDSEKELKKELTIKKDVTEHKEDLIQRSGEEKDSEKALKNKLTSKADVTEHKEDLIQMEVEEKDSEKRLKKEWTSKEDVTEHEKDLKQRSGEEKDSEKELKRKLTSKEDVTEHKGDLIQRNREAKDSEKALKKELTSKEDVTEHEKDLKQRDGEEKDREKELKNKLTSKEDVNEHKGDLIQRNREVKDSEKALKKDLTSKEDVTEHKEDLIQKSSEEKDSEKELKKELTSKEDVNEHKGDLIQRNREAKDREKALKKELTSKEDVTEHEKDLKQRDGEEKDREKELKRELTIKEDVTEHKEDLIQRSSEEKDSEKALKKELTSKEDVTEHKEDLIQKSSEEKDREKELKKELTSKADVTEHKEDLIQRSSKEKDREKELKKELRNKDVTVYKEDLIQIAGPEKDNDKVLKKELTGKEDVSELEGMDKTLDDSVVLSKSQLNASIVGCKKNEINQAVGEKGILVGSKKPVITSSNIDSITSDADISTHGISRKHEGPEFVHQAESDLLKTAGGPVCEKVTTYEENVDSVVSVVNTLESNDDAYPISSSAMKDASESRDGDTKALGTVICIDSLGKSDASSDEIILGHAAESLPTSDISKSSLKRKVDRMESECDILVSKVVKLEQDLIEKEDTEVEKFGGEVKLIAKEGSSKDGGNKEFIKKDVKIGEESVTNKGDGRRESLTKNIGNVVEEREARNERIQLIEKQTVENVDLERNAQKIKDCPDEKIEDREPVKLVNETAAIQTRSYSYSPAKDDHECKITEVLVNSTALKSIREYEESDDDEVLDTNSEIGVGVRDEGKRVFDDVIQSEDVVFEKGESEDMVCAHNLADGEPNDDSKKDAVGDDGRNVLKDHLQQVDVERLYKEHAGGGEKVGLPSRIRRRSFTDVDTRQRNDGRKRRKSTADSETLEANRIVLTRSMRRQSGSPAKRLRSSKS